MWMGAVGIISAKTGSHRMRSVKAQTQRVETASNCVNTNEKTPGVTELLTLDL